MLKKVGNSIKKFYKPMYSIIMRNLIWVFASKFNIAVYGIIFDKNNKIYLQKHRFWIDQSWGFPGGLINYNETLEEGLKREIFEESGLIVKVDKLLKTSSGLNKNLVVYYFCELISGEVKIDKLEVIKSGFFDSTDLPEPILKTHEKIINNYDIS
jgi:8-oxo-dGTP diphosphatase